MGEPEVTMQRLILRPSLRASLAVPVRQRSTAAAQPAGLDAALKADHSSGALSLFHKTNLLAIGLTPVAFVLPDSIPVAGTAINVFLGIVFPVHGHIGMSGVLTDYVPKFSRSLLGPARMALLGLTSVTVLGLLKLNLTGDGMTNSVKALWKKKELKYAIQ